MSQDPVLSGPDLSGVPARRAHLRRRCQDLAAVLSASRVGRADDWAREVSVSLATLREAFDRHVADTEGRGGLFEQIRADAPRLDPSLHKLHREHADIARRLSVADLAIRPGDDESLEHAREQLTAALERLDRHRQHGADLLHDAYQVDIGGE